MNKEDIDKQFMKWFYGYQSSCKRSAESGVKNDLFSVALEMQQLQSELSQFGGMPYRR